MKVRTVFEAMKAAAKDVGLVCCEETLTKQEFKEECDINRIMARYSRSGTVPVIEGEQPMYGDFSTVTDFLEAQLLVQRASDQFGTLDSKLRERFRNSPAAFLAFMEDPANEKEARELGLCNPLPAEPPPVKPMEVIVVDGAKFKPEGGGA